MVVISSPFQAVNITQKM